MSFVSAIVNDIFNNDERTGDITNPFLDPLPIFNCPLYYARNLNARFNDDKSSSGVLGAPRIQQRNFKPKTYFTADGLTVPVYGNDKKPLAIKSFGQSFIRQPYLIQELKDVSKYGTSIIYSNSVEAAGNIGSPNESQTNMETDDFKKTSGPWTFCNRMIK